MDTNTAVENIGNCGSLDLLNALWDTFQIQREQDEESVLVYSELMGLDVGEIAARLDAINEATNARFDKLYAEVEKLVSNGVLS